MAGPPVKGNGKMVFCVFSEEQLLEGGNARGGDKRALGHRWRGGKGEKTDKTGP